MIDLYSASMYTTVTGAYSAEIFNLSLLGGQQYHFKTLTRVPKDYPEQMPEGD